MNTFQYACAMKISYFTRDGRWDSNPGPLAPKSDALTTMLCRRKEGAILSWLFLPLIWLFLCKWPPRLPVASEVTSDLNSEFSGPNNLCSSASLGPKCFFEPFQRKEERKETKSHVDLRARTSPQVKTYSNHVRPE